MAQDKSSSSAREARRLGTPGLRVAGYRGVGKARGRLIRRVKRKGGPRVVSRPFPSGAEGA